MYLLFKEGFEETYKTQFMSFLLQQAESDSGPSYLTAVIKFHLTEMLK